MKKMCKDFIACFEKVGAILDLGCPSFRRNLVSTHYLENISDRIFNMHSYRQDLRWDCYTLFFAHLY